MWILSGVGFEPTPPLGDQNALSRASREGRPPWVWRLRPLGHPDNRHSNDHQLTNVWTFFFFLHNPVAVLQPQHQNTRHTMHVTVSPTNMFFLIIKMQPWTSGSLLHFFSFLVFSPKCIHFICDGRFARSTQSTPLNLNIAFLLVFSLLIKRCDSVYCNVSVWECSHSFLSSKPFQFAISSFKRTE